MFEISRVRKKGEAILSTVVLPLKFAQRPDAKKFVADLQKRFQHYGEHAEQDVWWGRNDGDDIRTIWAIIDAVAGEVDEDEGSLPAVADSKA